MHNCACMYIAADLALRGHAAGATSTEHSTEHRVQHGVLSLTGSASLHMHRRGQVHFRAFPGP
jgi:hypothetical protein